MIMYHLEIGVMPKQVPLQKGDKDGKIDDVLHTEDSYAQCRLEERQSESPWELEPRKPAVELEVQHLWKTESP